MVNDGNGSLISRSPLLMTKSIVALFPATSQNFFTFLRETGFYESKVLSFFLDLNNYFF